MDPAAGWSAQGSSGPRIPPPGGRPGSVVRLAVPRHRVRPARARGGSADAPGEGPRCAGGGASRPTGDQHGCVPDSGDGGWSRRGRSPSGVRGCCISGPRGGIAPTRASGCGRGGPLGRRRLAGVGDRIRADRIPPGHARSGPRPRGRSGHRHGEAGGDVRRHPSRIRHRAGRRGGAAGLSDAGAGHRLRLREATRPGRRGGGQPVGGRGFSA